MKSYCPCEISYHCGLCSTNTQKIEKTSDEQSKPTPLTLTFIQEICHLQRLTNRKQQYVSIDASNLNYLTSCLNGRLLWVDARLCCSHYALCMCGLLGIFSSLRWTVRWWVQTCFLMGDASLLGVGRKTLDVEWTAYLDITLVASQTAGAFYCIVYYIIILFII